MQNKDLFLTIEAISNEKNISSEDIFLALEEALSVTIKKHQHIDARVEVNRNTGEFETYRRWLVVADGTQIIEDSEEVFNEDLHIYKSNIDNLQVGDYKEVKIEPMEFGRIAAQVVKQVVMQKVREAEKSVIAKDYSKKVGEIVAGTVKRIDRGNVYLDLEGVDGIISKKDMIENESVRKNDRIKAYIKEVKSNYGVQIILSRTDVDMMIELFKIEVPEISEGVIEIKAGARDPGLRSKLAVKAKDRRLDPIGSCIGMRGSRVQAVSNELNGERIDVILWDENPAQFVINAMAPVKVTSIVVDEDKHSMDVAVEDEQLAQAIGKNGQNIKLASQLTGWRLNVMSQSQAYEKQEEENKVIEQKLSDNLGVDEDVAAILVDEGYTSVDEIVDASAEELTQIEEFDENFVEELKDRGQDALLAQALDDDESSNTLIEIKGIDDELAAALVQEGIKDQEALAELSTDELIDIHEIDRDRAEAIIMEARAPWFK